MTPLLGAIRADASSLSPRKNATNVLARFHSAVSQCTHAPRQEGSGLVRSGDGRDPSEGFRFVSDHQAAYPIATMCRLLGVSTSGYHAWVKPQPSHRAETDANATNIVKG